MQSGLFGFSDLHRNAKSYINLGFDYLIMLPRGEIWAGIFGASRMKMIVNPRDAYVLRLAEFARRLPHRWLPALSGAVGEFLYWRRRGRRHEVEKRYRILLGRLGLEMDPTALTRKFYRTQFLLLTANYVFQNADSPAWTDGTVIFEGLDEVVKVLQGGSGILITTMHFGSNMLSFVRLEHLGHQVEVMRKIGVSGVKADRERRMLFIHKEPVYVGTKAGLGSPVRGAVRMLQDGKTLGVAVDGNQGGGLMGLPMLGGTYPVRQGAAEIARLAGTPICFALGTYRNGKFLVRISKPEIIPRDAGKDVSKRMMEDYLRIFEDTIREYPECIWFTQPLDVALGLKPISVMEEKLPDDDA